jgi:alpha-1,3-rhamnosyl/mannosyltransferase
MKIIISTESIKYPLTGIGRYTLELVQQLQNAPEIDELLFFNHLNIQRELPPTAAAATNNLKTKVSWLKKQPQVIDLYRILFPIAQGRALKKYREDYIYHGPNFYLPANFSRSVVTFHDISTFTCPQFHPAERVRFMQKSLRSSIKRCAKIITDSEFTRQEVAQFFNYPLHNIHAISLGYAADFYPRNEEETQPLMHKLGLKYQQFTLYVGTIEPRKNIGALLDAYEMLPVALRKQYPLVLCGHEGWNSEDLHHRFQQAAQQGWLKYFGYLANEDLPLLYASARAFAFPSFYEGFGLPVVEAMASGVPVICSNVSSLPEVAGAAALTCAPQDVHSLSAHLQRSLEDESWRLNAREAGLKQAQTFSWEKCAQETADVYRALQE